MQLLSCQKIWDQAPHNAFTDLIRYQGAWYCAFREGEGHVSFDGQLRVLCSVDGEQWQPVALLGRADGDARDAKFTITAGGELMLLGAIRFHQPVEGNRHQSLTWLSSDGLNWSAPFACETGLGTWRWSCTWSGAYGYSVAYTGKDRTGALYRTADGKTWEQLVSDLFPEPETHANEASLVFDADGTAWCLLRRNAGNAQGWLGQAKAPYLQWQWQMLDQHVGGPKLLRLKDGRLLAGVRLIDFEAETATTSLCWIDAAAGRVVPALTLPSGGDTSYAGLVEQDDQLWVSYYSSHEGKTAIYLARVGL